MVFKKWSSFKFLARSITAANNTPNGKLSSNGPPPVEFLSNQPQARAEVKYKLGLCQLTVTADKERNIRHARTAIEEAAGKGAKLIALPEIWNGPYAEDIDAGFEASLSTAMLSEVSRLLKVTIVGGSIAERHGDKLYNTCCVFDSDGNLKAKHRKFGEILGTTEHDEAIVIAEVDYSEIELRRLLFTNLGGERRFASIVAKRLETLGALTQGDRRAGLSPSAYNYDSAYGKRALVMMYRGIMEQDRLPVVPPGCSPDKPDAIHDFVMQGKVALESVGIIRDSVIGNGKDGGNISGRIVDSDMHDAGRFLNRLLGLPPEIQNRIRDLLVQTAPAEGHLDSGIVDMRANRVELEDNPKDFKYPCLPNKLIPEGKRFKLALLLRKPSLIPPTEYKNDKPPMPPKPIDPTNPSKKSDPWDPLEFRKDQIVKVHGFWSEDDEKRDRKKEALSKLDDKDGNRIHKDKLIGKMSRDDMNHEWSKHGYWLYWSEDEYFGLIGALFDDVALEIESAIKDTLEEAEKEAVQFSSPKEKQAVLEIYGMQWRSVVARNLREKIKKNIGFDVCVRCKIDHKGNIFAYELQVSYVFHTGSDGERGDMKITYPKNAIQIANKPRLQKQKKQKKNKQKSSATESQQNPSHSPSDSQQKPSHSPSDSQQKPSDSQKSSNSEYEIDESKRIYL